MRENAKVVPLRRPRRGPSPEEVEALKERLRALEGELGSREAAGPEREGLLVALARLFQGGVQGVNWDRIAKLWSAAYFTWHSEEVDEFGYDPKFTEAIRPLFEFLYTVWWRVEATGIENVPAQGPALIVANHSGVLPYDG